MAQPDIRQRKSKRTVTVTRTTTTTTSTAAQNGRGQSRTQNEAEKEVGSFMFWINLIVGLALVIIIGYKHANFMYTLHENNLWFTNIKEVEREISFRTESGLYYSYYKQLVNAPSISQGLHSLIYDNATEHQRTINILERFNIYQEVVLAVLYRSVPLVQKLEPVFFYIDSVFALHGMLVAFLFLITWSLTNSWLSGALAATTYILNRADTTRVSYVIPLRESFALPFLWGQIFAISLFLGKRVSSKLQPWLLVLMGCCTFCFTVTWQFAQFVLLLQALTLYGLWVLDLIPTPKLRAIYGVHMGSILSVYVLQFGNKMLLGSLVFSLIPAVMIVSLVKKSPSQGRGFILGVIRVIGYTAAVGLISLLINKVVKVVINLDADEHIFKFLMAKFGLGLTRDFDANMYLCNGAFEFLTPDTFGRLSKPLVFPIYAVCHAGLLVLVVYAVIQNWCKAQCQENEETPVPSTAQQLVTDRPELAFHALQMVLFGGMALSVLRMKYLWTPYMCMFSAFAVSDQEIWRMIIKTVFKSTSKTLVEVVRHGLTLALFGYLLFTMLPDTLKELGELREFYDPDTVELMEWINGNTLPTAAFTGSMQLLAGVKLCTGRPLLNHPHYEDKVLRERTKELYQMYGRREPEDVHKIMMHYDVSYIILEDSICKAPSNGCRLPDLVDVDNGVIPDGGKPDVGLAKPSTARFCDEVRYGQERYATYFKLVFQNNTFRVYQVIR